MARFEGQVEPGEKDQAAERGADLESDLLERRERQVIELAATRARLKWTENALDAERKTQVELGARAVAERERVSQLEAQVESLTAERDRLLESKEELARERQNARALGSPLEQVSRQLQALHAGQAQGSSRWRRKR